MSSIYGHYIWFLRFDFNQERRDYLVKLDTEHKVVIRLSSVKKRGIRLYVVLTRSRLKQHILSLKRKKWLVISIVTEFWTEKRQNLTGHVRWPAVIPTLDWLTWNDKKSNLFIVSLWKTSSSKSLGSDHLSETGGHLDLTNPHLSQL